MWKDLLDFKFIFDLKNHQITEDQNTVVVLLCCGGNKTYFELCKFIGGIECENHLNSIFED